MSHPTAPARNGVSAPISRRVGSTGMAVYPVAIDAAVFGWVAGVTETDRVLDAFVSAGGNLISTADHYAGGRSETMIGSWLRREGHRERVVVATKIGSHPDARGLSATAIRRAVEASLTRLGTDHLDLLSFDREDPSVPLEESLTAAAELMAEGWFSHLGAAQLSGSTLREAARIAARLEISGFEVILQEYNLLERELFETEYEPIAATGDLGVFARLPLASGFLAGERALRREWIAPLFDGALRYPGRRGSRVLAALDRVGAQLGVDSGHVALAWVLARPRIAAPIVRVQNGAQLVQLLSAVDIVLSADQLAILDSASAY